MSRPDPATSSAPPPAWRSCLHGSIGFSVGSHREIRHVAHMPRMFLVLGVEMRPGAGECRRFALPHGMNVNPMYAGREIGNANGNVYAPFHLHQCRRANFFTLGVDNVGVRFFFLRTVARRQHDRPPRKEPPSPPSKSAFSCFLSLHFVCDGYCSSAIVPVIDAAHPASRAHAVIKARGRPAFKPDGLVCSRPDRYFLVEGYSRLPPRQRARELACGQRFSLWGIMNSHIPHPSGRFANASAISAWQ